jgi:hypothetical protein
MNKASPVLPTRPAFAFQGQTTKRRPSPTLHTTKTRRSSHSNSTADRALVAAAAAAAAVVLQRPKLCSTGAAHGKLWAVCFVWHYTTSPETARRWRRRRRSHCHRSRATLKSAMPQQIDHLLVNRCNENESKGPAAHF